MGIKLTHEKIVTDEAPKALGPYSQGVVVTELGLVFTAGQIGIDPHTGELVAGGTSAECGQLLDNLEAVLSAAGSGLDRVVKATFYLIDLADFTVVNSIYERRIRGILPARSTVAVSALPKGARIEVDLIATRR
jgi:2-iminobutanoate/2-iminopropanoate deaminase